MKLKKSRIERIRFAKIKRLKKYIKSLDQLFMLAKLKKPISPTTLSKELDIGYAWVHKTLSRFQKQELVTKKSKGRKVFFELTHKGRQHLNEIKNNI